MASPDTIMLLIVDYRVAIGAKTPVPPLRRPVTETFVRRCRDSVSTLSQFTTYVETANNNQRLDIEHIQAYVVDELQRQNDAANRTKQTCEQKLVELQYQLEDVSQPSSYCSAVSRSFVRIFFS